MGEQVNTHVGQGRSASDRAYEEKLLATWHERTGISAPLLRQLLNGAKVAARGGVNVPHRAPLVRGEVEAWMTQLIGAMSILGGLGVSDEDRKVGALGARYDAKIEQVWREGEEFGDEHGQRARQSLLSDRFTAALFLAYAPAVQGLGRERVLAIATRLAGHGAGCRAIEVQMHHLTRLAQVWLDEQFEAITAGL